MDNLKWEDLPAWLSPIILVIYIFRDHLKRGYEFLFKSAEDRREHRQEIEETELNSILQERATIHLRQREIDNQALEILRESLSWSRKEFSDMEHEIRSILYGINRTSDLLTLHNKMIAELIEETRGLVREVKQEAN